MRKVYKNVRFRRRMGWWRWKVQLCANWQLQMNTDTMTFNIFVNS